MAFRRQSSQPHRILVVDVDPYICHFSAEVLIRDGYEVAAAEDGAAAWESLTAAYDLVITDHNVPEVSGFELLKRLRAARMALPVIMATKAWPQKEFARYPRLQPTATLLKPYSPEEMLRTVKRILQKTDYSADGSHPSMNLV